MALERGEKKLQAKHHHKVWIAWKNEESRGIVERIQEGEYQGNLYAHRKGN